MGLNERGRRLADALAGLPDWTRGEVLAGRKRMVANLRRIARDLAHDPASECSLADLLALSSWTPPADDAPAHEAAAAPGSAVPALRALADALERGSHPAG